MWEEKPLWTFIKANWSQLLLLHPLALEDDCATVLQFDWLNVPLLTSSPSNSPFHSPPDSMVPQLRTWCSLPCRGFPYIQKRWHNRAAMLKSTIIPNVRMPDFPMAQ